MSDLPPPELTIEAARKRLGLTEDDSLEDFLPKWEKVKLRLSWMAKEALNEEAKASYERDFAELSQLIDLATSEAPEEVEPTERLEPTTRLEPAVREEKKKGGTLTFFLVLGLLGGGAYWAHQEGLFEVAGDVEVVNFESLQESFEVAIEKRRWDEAEALIGALKKRGAEEKIISDARAKLELGRVEEKGQQIAFLISNAQSALEAGQLSEAETFCKQVEVLQPGHPLVPEIRASIRESKLQVRSKLMVESIEKAMESEDWRTAKSQLSLLEQANPAYPKIPFIKATLQTAEAEMLRRKKRAADLVAQARALDEGTYSAEAIALMEEAVRLDPSEANRELYKRMASYGKVVNVPGDHETISAALKAAKKKDRVFVSKGVYHESLVIPDGVQVVGESRVDTIIECPAEVGAVVTIPADAKEVRIASLTLRHSGLVSDDERFPVVAINGGVMAGEDLLIYRASGHGVAVLSGGKAKLSLCKISDSGWDGVSVTGEQSRVILSKVTCESNLHHGVDFWDGASGSVLGSTLIGNGRNGIFAMTPSDLITVEQTRSEKNREVGFYFSGAAGASISDCEVQGNFLGGILFDQESKGVKLTRNRITKNGEAGLVFEKGVEILSESENVVEANTGKQIWRDAVFPKSGGEETITPPPPPPPAKEDQDN